MPYSSVSVIKSEKIHVGFFTGFSADVSDNASWASSNLDGDKKQKNRFHSVGLLEWNESGQIAGTIFVWFRGAQPDLHFIRFLGCGR